MEWGYLLSGGVFGVYFNDSTKLTVSPNRVDFQYYERGATLYSEHTITDYPQELRKKIILVKYIRNCLEKGNSDPSERLKCENADLQSKQAFPYVKKWVRTKHAVFFRMSNRNVQVAFMDNIQLLLFPESRSLLYIDSARNTQSMLISAANDYPEISKKLNYARDVLRNIVTRPQ